MNDLVLGWFVNMKKALGVLGIMIICITGYLAYLMVSISAELRDMHEHETEETSISR